MGRVSSLRTPGGHLGELIGGHLRRTPRRTPWRILQGVLQVVLHQVVLQGVLQGCPPRGPPEVFSKVSSWGVLGMSSKDSSKCRPARCPRGVSFGLSSGGVLQGCSPRCPPGRTPSTFYLFIENFFTPESSVSAVFTNKWKSSLFS
jgi:hypothetical protein